MKLWLNGRETAVDAARTLEEVLRHLEIDPAGPGIAVALNGRVVPRREIGRTDVREGDKLEVVRAVQGG